MSVENADMLFVEKQKGRLIMNSFESTELDLWCLLTKESVIEWKQFKNIFWIFL